MTPEQVEEMVNRMYDEERVRILVDDFLFFHEVHGRWYVHPTVALGIGLGLSPDLIEFEIKHGEWSASFDAIAAIASVSMHELEYFADGYDLKPCRLDNPECAPYYLAGFRVRAKYHRVEDAGRLSQSEARRIYVQALAATERED